MKVFWALAGAINRLAMSIEANTLLGYAQVKILRDMEPDDDPETEFDNWLRGPDGKVRKQ